MNWPTSWPLPKKYGSTYLIHRAHSYLALGGRQPFGFRVIPEYVVETVRGRLEVPRRLKIGTVDNFTLSSENVKQKGYKIQTITYLAPDKYSLTLYLIIEMHLNAFANRVDPDQAALVRAAWSGSTPFAIEIWYILHNWTWQIISLFHVPTWRKLLYLYNYSYTIVGGAHKKNLQWKTFSNDNLLLCCHL